MEALFFRARVCRAAARRDRADQFMERTDRAQIPRGSRRGVTLRCSVVVVAAVWASTAWGQEADLKRGETLVTRYCGGCHAVGRTGDSPHLQAPAFRTLGTRYPITAL